MTDLLQTGASWLAGKLKSYASKSVAFKRGAHSVIVSATIGRTLLKIDDGQGGSRMEWTDKDFIVTAADLILNGSLVTPQRDDYVREPEGASILVYQVMAPTGEPPIKDAARRVITRIHTKYLRTEPA